MRDRVFAIVNENEYASNDVLQLVEKVKDIGGSKVVVFSVKPDNFDAIPCELVKIPAEIDNRPKIKNFVVNYFKQEGFKGILHEIEDKVEIVSDPTIFVHDIENMMSVLELNNWCGTVTDACNYVYSKYNPRLAVKLDREEYVALGLNEVVFCSHSNVHWMAYDLEKADDNEFFFNEKFTVDMFWIIEFLARRRNTHLGHLYFMNQYFTCSSEKGTYRLKKGQKVKEETRDMDKLMKEEDALFKSLNVNYAPDNNIDNVLEMLYLQLKSKVLVKFKEEKKSNDND